MSLHASLVERIFEKLTLVFGHRFLTQWAGIDLAAVKADWAYELSAYQHQLEAIRHALQNLPSDHPPTVLQFRDLCRRYNAPPAPALPTPTPNPERLSETLKRLAAVEPKHFADWRDWAIALRRREAADPRSVRRYQRAAWREAMHLGPNHPALELAHP